MEKTSLIHNVFGIYEKAIPNHFTWDEKIEVAKKAGFEFIEISIDESDERLSRLTWSQDEINLMNKRLDENNFYIRSMCLSGHRRFPLGSHDEQLRERAYEMVDQAFLLAQKLKITNIQLAGYDVYYETSDHGTVKRFEEGLAYIAKIAERYNIMASIEIMDTPFIGTILKGLKYVELINSPYLQLYPDLGNLARWSDNPYQELEIGKSHIVAIHLKDTKPNVFKCVPFGDGTVDFTTYFKTLTKLNYQGPFVVEMWADHTLNETHEQVIKRLNEAKRWLQERMV